MHGRGERGEREGEVFLPPTNFRIIPLAGKGYFHGVAWIAPTTEQNEARYRTHHFHPRAHHLFFSGWPSLFLRSVVETPCWLNVLREKWYPKARPPSPRPPPSITPYLMYMYRARSFCGGMLHSVLIGWGADEYLDEHRFGPVNSDTTETVARMMGIQG